VITPDPSIVPSLMFHSVGLDQTSWIWSRMSQPLWLFEGILRQLQRARFDTVFWDEVYKHVAGDKRLRSPSIMLTFDDGYLDNWVLVWPLLKRYGMRATVFVSTDFIEPDAPARPTIESVWDGSISADQLEVAGFLRPAEIRKMADSGLVDVQSHAATHTSLFTAPAVVDIYDASKYALYPWLAWNARPDRKPFYMVEDQSSLIVNGQPVFEHADAIIAREFRPDPTATEEFLHEWKNSEPHRLRNSAGKHAELVRIQQRLKLDRGWPGSQETGDEHRIRVERELITSRSVLQAIAGKPVEFICWPRGKYDDVAVNVAKECGFRSRTLGSRDLPDKRNEPGGDPGTLRRISTEYRLFVRGVDCGIQNPTYQALRIAAHQRSLLHKALLLAYKAAALLRASVRSVL